MFVPTGEIGYDEAQEVRICAQFNSMDNICGTETSGGGWHGKAASFNRTGLLQEFWIWPQRPFVLLQRGSSLFSYLEFWLVCASSESLAWSRIGLEVWYVNLQEVDLVHSDAISPHCTGKTSCSMNRRHASCVLSSIYCQGRLKSPSLHAWVCRLLLWLICCHDEVPWEVVSCRLRNRFGFASAGQRWASLPQPRTLTVLLGKQQGHWEYKPWVFYDLACSSLHSQQRVSLMCAWVAMNCYQRPLMVDIYKIQEGHPCHLPARWDMGQGRIWHPGPQILKLWLVTHLLFCPSQAGPLSRANLH